MSTLKVNSIIPVAGVPTGGGGGIVQIKMNTNTTTQGSVSCSTSTEYYDITDLNVTITPTSSSSKILVNFTLFGEGSVSDHRIGFRLKRAISGGSTTFIQGTSDSQYCTLPCMNYQGDSNSTPATGHFGPYLDSPSTSSAVTYTVQVRFHEDNNATWYYNRSVNPGGSDHESGVSCITAMEVSA
jgi:hypothetical protein